MVTALTPYKHSSGVFFEKLLSKCQLAERLGISESFINKLMIEDGLPYIKLGRAVRFRISEVMEFLNRRKRP